MEESNTPAPPVRTGVMMTCVCCLINRETGQRDRCLQATNIDQPFCNFCEEQGHNNLALHNGAFAPIPMEQLIEERRKAMER